MEKQPYGFIYKTTNLISGKIYIGQRKYQHNCEDASYLGSGTKFLNALKKYGKESFSREIIEETYSREDAAEKEIKWIAYYNSTNIDIGYNIELGGLGTSEHLTPIEVREKISKTLKSKVDTPEFKFQLSKAVAGNISKRKGKPGKPLSEETKQKLREANLGKVTSEEVKKKISESLKGRARPQEVIDRITSTKIANASKVSETMKKSWEGRRKGDAGYIPPKRKPLSEETKQKIRESRLKHSH